ncbi:MAG: Cof-type HAD-IIB family hydrolase, partial [Armatimonadetes bacterium]|nr:Cof-type HAD-IIB family hydrolase [Armatimonadota bacterium]
KIFVAVATGRTLREVILELEVHGLKFGEPIPHFVIPLEKYCYRIVNGKPTEDEALARWNRERLEEAKNAIERIVLPKASQWLQILSDAELSPNRWVLDTRAGWFSLAYDTPEQARRAEKFLEQFAAPHPELIVNRNFVFVGLVPTNGTKGKAVRFLAEVLGIPPERVMTIGDSINDFDMLNGEHGFFPVAVANAEPEIKDAALKAGGLVTSQPASDGVAEAIGWALGQTQC